MYAIQISFSHKAYGANQVLSLAFIARKNYEDVRYITLEELSSTHSNMPTEETR